MNQRTCTFIFHPCLHNHSRSPLPRSQETHSDSLLISHHCSFKYQRITWRFRNHFFKQYITFVLLLLRKKLSLKTSVIHDCLLVFNTFQTAWHLQGHTSYGKRKGNFSREPGVDIILCPLFPLSESILSTIFLE